jgi:hypothetical protein
MRYGSFTASQMRGLSERVCKRVIDGSAVEDCGPERITCDDYYVRCCVEGFGAG